MKMEKREQRERERTVKKKEKKNEGKIEREKTWEKNAGPT